MKNLVLLSLLMLLFSACSKQSSIKSHEIQLLKSNHIQRQAHISGDAGLLVSELADSMISINKGSLDVLSNKDIENRFKSYFGSVNYISWDDISPPVIEISEDRQTAAVHVKKLVDIQLKSDETNKHHFTQFAWTSNYKWINDQWKITSITSTDKPLTAEEAEKIKIMHSDTLFVINDKQLIPEGVAYDTQSQTLFVSSTYKQKIVAIDKNGKVYDFKKEQENGLWSTLGMEVDLNNRRLWVVSFNGHEVLPMKSPDPQTHWQSKLFEYDIDSGNLVNTYQLNSSHKNAFNDLTIDSSGKVYVTDSIQNKVYCLDPETEEFIELKISLADFVFPNGIAVSDEDKYLYISSRNGIVQYDLKNTSYGYLHNDKDLNTKRIDGLEYFQNSLIANQPYTNRILRFVLDENKSKIVDQKILEANNPYFDQPTTGVVHNNQFTYIANAQLASAFENGELKPTSELNAVKILSLKLE